MFDTILGISKDRFLAKYVIPANDNDAFNDNKCTFCWNSYTSEHPGVRILPCNHVFGHPCLLEMINAPNGSLCPICRSPLFRPPLYSTLRRVVIGYALSLTLKVLIGINKCIVFWKTLPAWLKFPLRFLMLFNNIYYYAGFLVSYCTNLVEGNSRLNLQWSLYMYWLCQRSGSCSAYNRPEASVRYALVIAFLAVLLTIGGLHQRFGRVGDRIKFSIVLFAAHITRDVVAGIIIPYIAMSFRLLRKSQEHG